jgi:hypothetical protein
VLALPPHGSETDDADEPRQVDRVVLQVEVVLHALEVEELISVTDFESETFLVLLPRPSQLLAISEEVKVCEYSHDVGKAMIVEKRNELECLHLEADTGVDAEEHEIGYFGEVHHGMHVRWALDECDPLGLARTHRDGSNGVLHSMVGVVLDE